MVERRVNRRYEEHLRPRRQHTVSEICSRLIHLSVIAGGETRGLVVGTGSKFLYTGRKVSVPLTLVYHVDLGLHTVRI